ncbi:hypothetical protein AwWohl_10490 [Gammaproteobacteria bacterium]|nr:hypothetical protein AwWohl_10490 [Gammaproteobacteria bacterium]
MGSLDIIILTIVGLSTVIAFFRGMVTEFISLFIWTSAFYISAQYAPEISEMLKHQLDDPFRSLLAFGLTFLAVLFAGGCLNIAITLLLRFLKISFLDRFLGLIFGFLRGMVIVGLATLIIMKTPLGDKDFSRKISNDAKTWVAGGGFKARIAPLVVDLLTGESKFSPYVVETSKLLASFIPKSFLESMDSKGLLESLQSPNLMDVLPKIVP